jgi:hypothetical protein
MSDLSSSHVLLSPVNQEIKLAVPLRKYWRDTVNFYYKYRVWDFTAFCENFHASPHSMNKMKGGLHLNTIMEVNPIFT